MDTNQLPANIGTSLTEGLQRLLPSMPPEILTIVLLTRIAQVANLNRVKVSSRMIEGGDNTMRPTLYSVFFASSGIGKDRALRVFDKEILKDIKVSFGERFKRYRDGIIKGIEKEIEDQGMTKTQALSHMATHQPHEYRWKFNHGTLEGLLSFASTIERVGTGCLYYEHSEFVDLLKRKDENALIYVDTLKTLYEGEATSKLIKQDKHNIEIKDCPTVMLAFSAIEGIEDEITRAKILELFSRGFGRRSFVVLESLSTKPILTDTINEDNILEYQGRRAESSRAGIQHAKNCFNEMFKNTRNDPLYRFSDDADKAILMYRLQNTQRAHGGGVTGQILNAEMNGRAWKAMQMAGLVAMFEHPEKLTVTREDVEVAIYLTELFGKHMESFFNNLGESPERKLYDYFLRNKNKRLNKMDLRIERFVHTNTFSRWLPEALEAIQPLIDQQGYTLEISSEGRATYYLLTDPWQPPEGDLVREQEIISKVAQDEINDTKRLKRQLTDEELIVEYEKSNDDNIIVDPF